MTWLVILCSVLLLALLIGLGIARNKIVIKLIGGSRSAAYKATGIDFMIYGVLCAEYWLLTGSAPTAFLLLALPITLVSIAFQQIIRGLLGINTREKLQKIGTLGVLLLSGYPKLLKAHQAFSAFALFGGWVGALWVFCTHGRYDPSGQVYIAVFLFVVLWVTGFCWTIINSIPVMTDQYIDQDLRNAHLLTNFDMAVSVAAFLLFPILLFNEDFTGILLALGLSRVPLWVLLAAPILGFLFGALLPFLFGLFRHRNETNNLIEWRIDWVDALLETAHLPEGEIRRERMDGSKERLAQEIDRISTNGGLQAAYMTFQRILEIPVQAHEEHQTNQGPAPKAQWNSKLNAILDYAGRISQGLQGSRRTAKSLEDIVAQNKMNFPLWDLRLQHLEDLILFDRMISAHEITELANYLKTKSEGLDKLRESRTRGKNILAASIISIASLAVVSVLKIYQEDLLRLAHSIMDLSLR